MGYMSQLFGKNRNFMPHSKGKLISYIVVQYDHPLNFATF